MGIPTESFSSWWRFGLVGMAMAVGLQGSKALAEEGFFRPEQIKLNFDVKALQGASLLVEEYQPATGSWKHIANGVFVTPKGDIVTNYHVAASCLYSNKTYFKTLYRSPSEVSLKGFVAENSEGVLCPGLRMKSSLWPDQNLPVTLKFLPRVPQGSEQGLTPQQSSGPFHDFAILKAAVTPSVWFSMKPSDKIQDLKAGSRVHMLSYPSETRRAENSALVQNKVYDDVQTGDYRIATGQLLDVSSDYFYQPQKDLYLYTSVDGAMGASGSALVSDKGDFVGLVLGSGSMENSGKFSDCIPRFQYCGGVSLFLRIEPLVAQMAEQAPTLLQELVEK